MTTAELPGPAAAGVNPASPPTRQSLTSWWERFKKKNNGKDNDKDPPGIFGVPLQKSINYANVAISLTDDRGEQFIYGYVPIVVAKCGVFLKEKATDVEGIFRLNGSSKRIKDLQTIFNSPEKYGKGLDWTGYTVHDAANVLRRYLNQLPEPIIPLDFYARFREPLATQDVDVAAAIVTYQQLISQLPPLNRQLLLYILDLLAVFASKSAHNRMTAPNLAAIFQPGLISHPSHEMTPDEYRLSQEVLVFLIEHQDNFLLGMRGTNDGEGLGLQQPRQPSTPIKHSKTVVARSSSNSSVGADDVRRYGNVRRNVSVSSRKSGSPAARSSGGVSRSNTLPSKRSPRLPTSTFRPDGNGSPHASSIGHPSTVAAQLNDRLAVPSKPSAASSPKQPALSPLSSDKAKAPTPVVHSATTPTRDRNFAGFFSLSPPADADKPARQPNKLRKRRIPGSANHSAESSTTSLPAHGSSADVSAAPPLEPVPGSPAPLHIAHGQAIQSNQTAPAGSQGPGLMPAMSPTPSATSSVTSQSSSHSYSDTMNTSPKKHKKTRSRWRLSNPKLDQPLSPTFGPSSSNGSLVERMRRGSRSPPDNRKLSGETAPGSSEDEAKKHTFGWLTRRRGGRKGSVAGESDRDHEDKDVPPLVEAGSLPPPRFPAPMPPLVQPPTPSSQLNTSEPNTPAEGPPPQLGDDKSTDQSTPRPMSEATDSTLTPPGPDTTHNSEETIKLAPTVESKTEKTEMNDVKIPGEKLEPANDMAQVETTPVENNITNIESAAVPGSAQ